MTSMAPALVIALIEGLLRLLPIVEKLRQNKELTPEQEAALDSKIADLNKSAWWKLEQTG